MGSIKNLIQKKIWNWIAKNSDDPAFCATIDPKSIWITPLAKDSAGYDEVIASLISRYENYQLQNTLSLDELYLGVATEEKKLRAWVSSPKELIKNISDGPFSLLEIAPTFMLKMTFIVSCDLAAKKPIPIRLFQEAKTKKIEIFESDLEEYMPPLSYFDIEATAPNSSTLSIYTTIISNIEKENQFLFSMSNPIAEAALKIPIESYSWLAPQWLYSLRCRRRDQQFLALYRIFEFFFPMKGLLDLMGRISYSDAILKLKDHCETGLGWNLNHQRGARAAIDFSGKNFAVICLGRDIHDSEGESELRFKETAAEKLTDLRHKLAHQPFGELSISNDEIERKIHALFVYFADAFPAHKSRVEYAASAFKSGPAPNTGPIFLN